MINITQSEVWIQEKVSKLQHTTGLHRVLQHCFSLHLLVTHAQGLIQSPLKTTECTHCISARGKDADENPGNSPLEGFRKSQSRKWCPGDIIVYASLLRFWLRYFWRMHSLSCLTGNPIRQIWKKETFHFPRKKYFFCCVEATLSQMDATNMDAQMK